MKLLWAEYTASRMRGLICCCQRTIPILPGCAIWTACYRWLSLNAQPEMQILNGLQHMYTILRYFNVLHDLPFWKTVGQYVLLELQTKSIHATYVAVAMHRSPEVSTNQAYSSCLGILMEQPNCSLSFLQGLRSTNIKYRLNCRTLEKVIFLSLK